MVFDYLMAGIRVDAGDSCEQFATISEHGILHGIIACPYK